MTFHRKNRVLSIILGAISSISLLFFIYMSLKLYNTNRQEMEQAQIQAQEKTISTAQDVNSFITLLKPLVHEFADTLSKQKISKNDIIAHLQKKPVDVSGFGIAYIPYGYDDQTKLYAPYVVEKKAERVFTNIADAYDYTQASYMWFHDPLTQGPSFHEVYSKPDKHFLVEYAEPFYAPEDTAHTKPIGIVYANQSAQHIKQVLSTRYLGKSGYWFIINQEGEFIVHPKTGLVTNRMKLHDLMRKQSDPTLVQQAYEIRMGKHTIATYFNDITGAESWLMSAPIQSTHWVLCGVFDLKEIPNTTDTARHYLFIIITSLVLAIISFILCTCACMSMHTIHLWIISAITSFTLVCGLVSLWTITYWYPDYIDDLHTIKDKNELYDFVTEYIPEPKSEYTNEFKKLAQQNHFLQHTKNIIPTGIFISHMSFTSEQEISLVGYVWQRYTKGVHDNLSRKIVLPQAHTATITEISQSKGRLTETVIWHVQAILDQKLSFTQYPFDVKDLQIQLWHGDFDKNIFLIPDFDSYQVINPRSLPGINREAYLPGWNLVASDFGYHEKDYHTIFGMYKMGEFGLYKQIDKSAIPEFYFHVKTKRHLADTLIADLIPLAVIALLLFIIIMMTGYQELSTILGACATVFFGMVVAQVRFREKTPSNVLVYFENFYFVLYLLIITIILISLLYSLETKVKHIHDDHNLLLKLLYWPILFGSLFTITLVYLY